MGADARERGEDREQSRTEPPFGERSDAIYRAVIPREGGARLRGSIATALEYRIPRRSLSTGAHSRDPVADDDSANMVGSLRMGTLPRMNQK